MQPTTTTGTTATLGADAPEDRLFLAAIQDENKRNEVISILKRVGLIPEYPDRQR